jgi:hypothetical protein
MAEKYVSCLFAIVRVGWWTTGANEFDTTPTLHDLVPAYKILKSECDGAKGIRVLESVRVHRIVQGSERMMPRALCYILAPPAR